MFRKDSNTENLETLINSHIDSMSSLTGDEYTKATKELDRLYKLKEVNASKPLSRDALLAAGVSVANVILIVNFERLHVWTTKALGSVPKIR